MEKLYKAEEIAEMFGVEITTVWLWFRQNKLKYTKIGKRKLVKESDLMAYLESGESNAERK